MTFSPLSDNQVGSLLSLLSDHEQFVFLDSSKPDEMNRRSLLFTRPVRQLQHHAGRNRQAFLDETASWLDQGYYLAGWFSYEFLHDELSSRLSAEEGLLADFGVYPPPRVFDHREQHSGFNDWPASGESTVQGMESGYTLNNLQPAIQEQEYCQAIRKILEYIAAGDTYQVNYTFKMNFDFVGSAAALYRELRRSQPVPYGCCMKNGDRYTLSFSPELFFRMGSDTIVARPMKGTAGRGLTDAQDLRNARFLENDEKNRSENVMIVDLLRNDLSRLVAATGGGSVEVASLFDVERYRTVLQMTSTVVATRFSDSVVTPEQILKAIFPCGSVTGAPKIRTMEIIDELEKQPRGVYTGAIGYFSPDRQAVFNVPIRTVVLSGGRGEMGIGSGIVADSSPEDEWRECLLKSRFLSNPPMSFQLFETLLHDPRSGYLLLDEHLQRLEDSARYFGFSFSQECVGDDLKKRAINFDQSHCLRVRLTLDLDGTAAVATTPCAEPQALQLPDKLNSTGLPEAEVDFADEQTDSSSCWLYHKTTRREQYDRLYQLASSRGLFDLIFCNERQEVTEGCITNIIVRLNGAYFTPPQHCGLLGGTLRRQLLVGQGPVQVRERVLFRNDLLRAEAIYLCNSVRGIVRVRLRDPGSKELLEAGQ